MPYSALRCIGSVRIWTSTAWPSGPITVVCSERYRLFFGRGDEVLEPADDRAPRGVDRPERGVAVVLRSAHDDRDAGQLVRCRVPLVVGVLPDRVEVVRAGHDPGLDLLRFEDAAGLADHPRRRRTVHSGRWATQVRSSAWISGSRAASTLSSRSRLRAWMPSRSHSGISTSWVARAMRDREASDRASRVSMLCSRSASLTTSTRTSMPAATSILRMVSTSAASP